MEVDCEAEVSWQVEAPLSSRGLSMQDRSRFHIRLEESPFLVRLACKLHFKSGRNNCVAKITLQEGRCFFAEFNEMNARETIGYVNDILMMLTFALVGVCASRKNPISTICPSVCSLPQQQNSESQEPITN